MAKNKIEFKVLNPLMNSSLKVTDATRSKMRVLATMTGKSYDQLIESKFGTEFKELSRNNGLNWYGEFDPPEPERDEVTTDAIESELRD